MKMGYTLTTGIVDKRKWPIEKLEWIKNSFEIHNEFSKESTMLSLDKEIPSFNEYNRMVKTIYKNPIINKDKLEKYPFIGDDCVVLSRDKLIELGEMISKLNAIKEVSNYFDSENRSLNVFLSDIDSLKFIESVYEYVWYDESNFFMLYKVNKAKWTKEYMSGLFHGNYLSFHYSFNEETELFDLGTYSYRSYLECIYACQEEKGISKEKSKDHPLHYFYGDMIFTHLSSSEFEKVLLEIKSKLHYLRQRGKDALNEVSIAKEKGEIHSLEKFVLNDDLNEICWVSVGRSGKSSEFFSDDYECALLMNEEENFNFILKNMKSEEYEHKFYDYTFWLA